jgi:hypothetical protein
VEWNGVPNILVNSPGALDGGAGAAGGIAGGGKPEGEGNCGPAPPGGGALKKRVNSPGSFCPPGWGGLGWAEESSIRVKSPLRGCSGAGGGQSPGAGACGSGDWNIRVNSPGSASDGAGGAEGVAGSGAEGVAGSGAEGAGAWNIRVNSPGAFEGGTCGDEGCGWKALGGAAAAGGD